MMESKEALRAQIATLEEQVQRIERREKALADLNVWLETNQLTAEDFLWLAKQVDKPNGSHPPADEQAAPTEEPHFTKPVVRRKVRAKRHGNVSRKGDRAFQVRLAAKRKGRGWTPEQLAKRIGVSGSSIRFWEAGRAVPTERNRSKLVTILGLPATAGAAATAAMEAAMAPKA